jgi:hypothetical protein
MNKISFESENPNSGFDKKNPDVETVGIYAGAIKGPDSLIPVVHKINDLNLTSERYDKMDDFRKLLSDKWDLVEEDDIWATQEKIHNFINKLKVKYGEESVNNCAYYYILGGSTLIPDAIERVDLDGVEGGLIRNFVVNNFSEPTN